MSRSRNTLLAAGIASTLFAGFGFYQYYRLKRKSSLKRSVDTLMQVLDQRHVHIRDSAILREKLAALLSDLSKIQVLTDFDHTISKSVVNGAKGATCHGVIEKSSLLPAKFQEEIAALKAKYYPLEMSPTLTFEEKVPLMVEWYEAAHEMMGKTQIRKEWLKEMVSESNVTMRDGTSRFFQILEKRNIPLLIFSAGVGDILVEAIEQKATMPSNAHVISNFMDFDEAGDFHGFKGELIHSYNKHEASIHNKEYFDKLKSRNELIILGDTIGDMSMADGIDYAKSVLKIGFLNQNVEKSLASYKEAFDVVIVEDQTMDIVNVLLEELLRDA